MDTSRPIDNATPGKELQTANIRRAQAAQGATSEQSRAQTSPANVAASVHETRRLIDAGRNQVDAADAQKVAELKQAIEDGTFEVDFDALADRMIGDALGEE